MNIVKRTDDAVCFRPGICDFIWLMDMTNRRDSYHAYLHIFSAVLYPYPSGLDFESKMSQVVVVAENVNRNYNIYPYQDQKFSTERFLVLFNGQWFFLDVTQIGGFSYKVCLYVVSNETVLQKFEGIRQLSTQQIELESYTPESINYLAIDGVAQIQQLCDSIELDGVLYNQGYTSYAHE